MKPTLLLLVVALALSACGGMTRAVGVLPDTLDDLADERARAEAPRAP